jgi:hypothetical protein
MFPEAKSRRLSWSGVDNVSSPHGIPGRERCTAMTLLADVLDPVEPAMTVEKGPEPR